jgi:hypothetical protein
MAKAKVGSYRWEGQDTIRRSLDKDAKNEIAEALEDVVGVDCDEGPVLEGSGLTPVQIFHSWSNVTLLLQTAA